MYLSIFLIYQCPVHRHIHGGDGPAKIHQCIGDVRGGNCRLEIVTGTCPKTIQSYVSMVQLTIIFNKNTWIYILINEKKRFCSKFKYLHLVFGHKPQIKLKSHDGTRRTLK